MTWNAAIVVAIYCGLLLLVAGPLGRYVARVYRGDAMLANRVFGPIERLVYRVARVDAGEEMTWQTYARSVLAFSAAGIVVVYVLQRAQALLPLDPNSLPAVSADSAFNTAVSFVSNTNWQSYAGESTLAHSTQMLGLTVQSFVSAATGMAVLVALVRGFARRSTPTIGSFWVDLVRGTLFVLLPLSAVLALVLVGQGVVQTFAGSGSVPLVESTMSVDGAAITDQTFALGPAASQIAIKQLGTNGGGFFNANSAHPFENPTPLSNFVEMVSLLLLPVALSVTFGELVSDRRQGRALLAAMFVLFLPLLWLCLSSEQGSNPAFAGLPIDDAPSALQAGGNMEGKEVRFGITSSALWATATTAASNGSVNAMHDSFTPIGGLVPMWLMMLGEVVFGGVGSGLYGMLAFAIVAVFVAGLMVGRTPEYLGKKIEAFEMKMVALVILVPPALALCGAAIASVSAAGRAGVGNPGPHGFSEILYAFASTSNNNGSAFAGLAANTTFYDVALAVCMFCARFWLVVPLLALAGALARKKRVPPSSGTLPTHTPLFVAMLVGVVLVVGALTFIPALCLGPLVEHLASRARS